jgi:hypothetical protein
MPDDTEAQRLAQERLDDRVRDAEQRGAAAERIKAELREVSGRIDRHEQRLDIINGSVIKTGEKLDTLSGKIDLISSKQDQRDAISNALLSQSSMSGAKALTRWQVIGIIAGVIFGAATLILLLLSTIHGLGSGGLG